MFAHVVSATTFGRQLPSFGVFSEAEEAEQDADENDDTDESK